MAISVAMVALAIASGRYSLIVPAILIGIAAGITRLVAAGRKAVDPTRPHVGMGAHVGEGARLEPGSWVGAGASVGAGAHLEPGAVVGMGASVGKGAVLKRDARVSAGASVGDEAVLEAGATVASGSDVGRGATVGEGARVSSGASVGKGAYVPAGMRVRAGSTWNNTDRGVAPVKAPALPAPPVADPRAARIDAGCAKLEAEIQKAPPQAREYLGASLSTVRALRDTCHGLLRREQALRTETSAGAAAELEEERSALQKRLDAASDEHVRRSLASAVAAIDEQKRQRELMARTADRLDAELTRLLWTVDGMGAQLVRLRTAGAEVGAAGDLETAKGVKKLQDEIGAIADALEEIGAAQRAEIIPVSDIGGGDGSAGAPDRPRERS
jgi:carbonic anhydrase/acetyltransferase-like protein (isoleucine patch superfamily)